MPKLAETPAERFEFLLFISGGTDIFFLKNILSAGEVELQMHQKGNRSLKFLFQKLDKEGALIKMDFSPSLIRRSFKDFLLSGPGDSAPLTLPSFHESGINTQWRLVYAASASFISKITGVSSSGAAGWPGGGTEEGRGGRWRKEERGTDGRRPAGQMDSRSW